MRKLKVALAAVLGSLVCIFAALGVAACNREPEATTYTVTFIYDNGSENSQVTVTEGETVEKPTDPTKTNFTFAGWYVNASTQYDFTKAVTTDLSLTAHWNPVDTSVAISWGVNEATEYVSTDDSNLPTSVEKGTEVMF